jgi:hypothetical protein
VPDNARRAWLSLAGPESIVLTVEEASDSVAELRRRFGANWDPSNLELTLPASVANYEAVLAVFGHAVRVGPMLVEWVEAVGRDELKRRQTSDEERRRAAAAAESKTELQHRADKAALDSPRTRLPRAGDAATLNCTNCRNRRLHVFEPGRRSGSRSYWRCQQCGSAQPAN